MAERNHDRACQRRDIDDGLGLVAFGVSERIGEYQPAFGVGVQYLDGLSRHALDDVAGFARAPRRQVFARGNESHDVQLGLELGNRSKYAEHRRSAAHVELHLVHVGRRFDRDAAAVECNALADEDERPLLSHGPVVLQDDEARRLFTTIRDGQE